MMQGKQDEDFLLVIAGKLHFRFTKANVEEFEIINWDETGHIMLAYKQKDAVGNVNIS